MNFNTEIEQPSNTPKEEPLQVICSGILNTRLSEVLAALEKAGMQILSTQQQDDWCRVTAALA